jgi:hypothetical protein
MDRGQLWLCWTLAIITGQAVCTFAHLPVSSSIVNNNVLSVEDGPQQIWDAEEVNHAQQKRPSTSKLHGSKGADVVPSNTFPMVFVAEKVSRVTVLGLWSERYYQSSRPSVNEYYVDLKRKLMETVNRYQIKLLVFGWRLWKLNLTGGVVG